MSTFQIQDTVGDIVTRCPSVARVFEQLQIDYCCGGQQPLGEACAAAAVEADEVLRRLADAAGSAADGAEPNLAEMSLTGLAGHIEATHHEFLRGELPRLRRLTDDFVAPEWACNTYRTMLAGLAELEWDLHRHIHKENSVLFPRALTEEARRGTPA